MTTTFPSTSTTTTPSPSASTTTTPTSSSSVTSTNLTLPVVVDGKYFRPVTIKDNGEVEAVCVLCESVLTQRNGKLKKKSTIKGSVKANSNWLTHLKRKHADNFPDYEKYAKAEEEKRRLKNQPKLPFKITKTDKKAGQIESFILEYVIDGMRPLSTVDEESFVKMVQGIAAASGGDGSFSVMSRNTLKERIRVKFKNECEVLKRKLEKVDYVCCTADLWSNMRRSYMGVTAHWLNDNNERESVVLSIKRFEGKHSYDRIATMLSDIFEQFEIKKEKVVAVITDNRSNFVKAFRVYGLQFEEEAEDVEADENDEDGPCEVVDWDDVEVTDIPEGLSLPPHIRCGSHTLHLVASNDMQKYLPEVTESSASRRGSRAKPTRLVMTSAFEKCSALWNHTSRSSGSDSTIESLTGKALIRPCATRWNSWNDSVKRLLEFKGKLEQIFSIAGQVPLTEVEIEFLEDYTTAMTPIAVALDKLQSEKEMFYGLFLPIIYKSGQDLSEIHNSSSERKFAKEIAGALFKSLKIRYPDIMNDNLSVLPKATAAAVSHPYFRTRWLHKDQEKPATKILIAEAKKIQISQAASPSTDIVIEEDEDSYSASLHSYFKYDDEEATIAQTVKLDCLQYLRDKGRNLSTLDRYPFVKSVFKKLNTPLTSSAPVERLFSYGKMIFSAKRNRMDDDLFEQFTFLK